MATRGVLLSVIILAGCSAVGLKSGAELGNVYKCPE